MTKERKVTVRYSDCFKRSVIEEIEKNGLSTLGMSAKICYRRSYDNSKMAQNVW